MPNEVGEVLQQQPPPPLTADAISAVRSPVRTESMIRKEAVWLQAVKHIPDLMSQDSSDRQVRTPLSRDASRRLMEAKESAWLDSVGRKSTSNPSTFPTSESEKVTIPPEDDGVSSLLDTDYFSELLTTENLERRLNSLAALTELELLELWVRNKAGVMRCEYKYFLAGAQETKSDAQGLSEPGGGVESTLLCEDVSGTNDGFVWRTRAVGGSCPGNSSKPEICRTEARTQVGLLLEESEEDGRILFLAGYSLEQAHFSVEKILCARNCLRGFLQLGLGTAPLIPRLLRAITPDDMEWDCDPCISDDSELPSELPSVIPTWQPRAAFCFPVSELQVRHQSTSYLSLEDFRDIRYLSKGSRVEVSTAVILATGRKVVIKMLRADCMESNLALHEFETEHGMLARINHPNIVRLLGAGRIPRPFVALEWLEGGTLSSALRSQTSFFGVPRFRLRSTNDASFDVALLRIKALAEALDYLHMRVHPDATIIHRDLKPDNVGEYERTFSDQQCG
jgi:hypothetical protein